MKTIELDFSPLKDYLITIYDGNVKYIATELRKLAIDYSRLNLLIEANGNGYISDQSVEYLYIISSIADLLDKIIKTEHEHEND